MQTFDLQKTLWNLFVNNIKLQEILGISDVTDMDLCNKKIRRKKDDSTLIETESNLLPFFNFVFIPGSASTNNYLLNKVPLQFNIYYIDDEDVSLLYKQINRILKDNFEDMKIVSEGQYELGLQNIFCYRFVVTPFVNS